MVIDMLSVNQEVEYADSYHSDFTIECMYKHVISLPCILHSNLSYAATLNSRSCPYLGACLN